MSSLFTQSNPQPTQTFVELLQQSHTEQSVLVKNRITGKLQWNRVWIAYLSPFVSRKEGLEEVKRLVEEDTSLSFETKTALSQQWSKMGEKKTLRARTLEQWTWGDPAVLKIAYDIAWPKIQRALAREEPRLQKEIKKYRGLFTSTKEHTPLEDFKLALGLRMFEARLLLSSKNEIPLLEELIQLELQERSSKLKEKISKWIEGELKEQPKIPENLRENIHNRLLDRLKFDLEKSLFPDFVQFQLIFQEHFRDVVLSTNQSTFEIYVQNRIEAHERTILEVIELNGPSREWFRAQVRTQEEIAQWIQPVLSLIQPAFSLMEGVSFSSSTPLEKSEDSPPSFPLKSFFQKLKFPRLAFELAVTLEDLELVAQSLIKSVQKKAEVKAEVKDERPMQRHIRQSSSGKVDGFSEFCFGKVPVPVYAQEDVSSERLYRFLEEEVGISEEASLQRITAQIAEILHQGMLVDSIKSLNPQLLCVFPSDRLTSQNGEYSLDFEEGSLRFKIKIRHSPDEIEVSGGETLSFDRYSTAEASIEGVLVLNPEKNEIQQVKVRDLTYSYDLELKQED